MLDPSASDAVPEAMQAFRLQTNAATVFVVDYDLEQGDERLVRLYERAQKSQWSIDGDLDWNGDVDLERYGSLVTERNPWLGAANEKGLFGTWDDKQRATFAEESQRWVISQFLHTEQAALLCAAHLALVVPSFDAKLFLGTQALDEAKHATVFSRYLNLRLQARFPLNGDLADTVRWSIEDPRWDMTCLGMQVLIEGTALAAFSFVHEAGADPLLRQILRYVMADEARHLAFGVLSLQGLYAQLSDSELLDRQEFVLESMLSVRRRYTQAEVWEQAGASAAQLTELRTSDVMRRFDRKLMSNVLPSCDRLGLLDANAGWLRSRVQEFC